MNKVHIGKKYRVNRFLMDELNIKNDIVQVVAIQNNNIIFSSNDISFQIKLSIFINNIEEITSIGNKVVKEIEIPKDNIEPIEEEPIEEEPVEEEPVEEEPVEEEPIEEEPVEEEPDEDDYDEYDFDDPFGPGGY